MRKATEPYVNGNLSLGSAGKDRNSDTSYGIPNVGACSLKSGSAMQVETKGSSSVTLTYPEITTSQYSPILLGLPYDQDRCDGIVKCL